MMQYLHNCLYGTWKELNEREIEWKFDTQPGPYVNGLYTMHKDKKTLGKGTFLISKIDQRLQVTLKGAYTYDVYISAKGREMTWSNIEELRKFVLV
jgi:hypothetical protein